MLLQRERRTELFREPEDMMSDKCAPALDVSVAEQGSFGSFGEDSMQTLLSLALADPERAKERFPAYSPDTARDGPI